MCVVDDGTAWAVNDALRAVNGSAKLTDTVLDGTEFHNHFLYGKPPFKWSEIRGLVRGAGR